MKGAASLEEPLPLDNQLGLRLRAISAQPAQKSQPATAKSAAPAIRATPAASPADDLDELNAFLAATDDIPIDTETAASASPLSRPPHYWTWRVFAAGFSLDECQQIRALGREKVLDHLLAAARAGESIPVDRILTIEHQSQLDSLLSNGAPKTLDSLVLRLPPTISPIEAELYLLATASTGPSKS